MSDEETVASVSKEIGKFALRESSTGLPQEAAVDCFIAGICLLAFAQECFPQANGAALLEQIFDGLRKTFQDMTQPGRPN